MRPGSLASRSSPSGSSSSLASTLTRHVRSPRSKIIVPRGLSRQANRSSRGRRRSAERKSESVESGSRSCSSTLSSPQSSGIGSHGSPSVKPNVGGSVVHGSGTRQPSRPFRAPAVWWKIGSWRASSGTSTSSSPSSWPS